MLVGYAGSIRARSRISPAIDALKTAGCSKEFEEKAPGPQRERPALNLKVSGDRDGHIASVAIQITWRHTPGQ